MNLSEHIKNWVYVDNQIKIHCAKTKELRSKKTALTQNIFHYAEQNNLQNAVIEISDGKLKFQNIKQTSPLNFKFLEKCLNECIDNEKNVKDIINYIKQKREIKFYNDIKRSYK
tara:strand:+ start:238 stop:579 length:342 start_codon:yes stop_codon:yes gene_type:complete